MKKQIFIAGLIACSGFIHADENPDTKYIQVTIHHPLNDGFNYFTNPVVSLPDLGSPDYCTADSSFKAPFANPTDGASYEIGVEGIYDGANRNKNCMIGDSETYFGIKKYSFKMTYRTIVYNCAVNAGVGLTFRRPNQSATVGGNYADINCSANNDSSFYYHIDSGSNVTNGGIDIYNNFAALPQDYSTFNLYSTYPGLTDFSLSAASTCLDGAVPVNQILPATLSYQVADIEEKPSGKCSIHTSDNEDVSVKTQLNEVVISFLDHDLGSSPVKKECRINGNIGLRGRYTSYTDPTGGGVDNDMNRILASVPIEEPKTCANDASYTYEIQELYKRNGSYYNRIIVYPTNRK